MTTQEHQKEALFYALEDDSSPWATCCRLTWPSWHPWTYHMTYPPTLDEAMVQLPKGKLAEGDKVQVTVGTRRIQVVVPKGKKGGEWIDVKVPAVSIPEGKAPGDPFVDYVRPMRCGPAPLKLCCHQKVVAKVDGKRVGSTKEACYCCVPSFNVLDAKHRKTHVVHQPTCCGGLLVDSCAIGLCSCHNVYHIYKADNDRMGHEVGSITKKWGGVTKETLTDADTFSLVFPLEADANTRATLVGSTFLLNQLYFE